MDLIWRRGRREKGPRGNKVIVGGQGDDSKPRPVAFLKEERESLTLEGNEGVCGVGEKRGCQLTRQKNRYLHTRENK